MNKPQVRYKRLAFPFGNIGYGWMPSLKMTVPHALGQEAATEKLKSYLEMMLENAKDKVSNQSHSWTNNVLQAAFTTMGFAVKGTLTVLPESVVIDSTIPFALMMFKGKIESEIRDKLTRILR